MTRREELNLEIRNQAIRLAPKCIAYFELPSMVYNQIMTIDNVTRKKPFRVSQKYIQAVIHEMIENNELA